MEELNPTIAGSSPEQKPRPTVAEREAYILCEINDNSQSRDQVAADLGINDNALYMFMRRKGYSWCGVTKKFNKKASATPPASTGDKVPQAANTSQEQPRATINPLQTAASSPERPAPAEDNSRQAKVMRLITAGMDCETAAHTEGFADRHELGRFMADNGYRWSCEIGNYVAADNGSAGTGPYISVQPEASEDDFVLFSDHGFEPLATPGPVPWANESAPADLSPISGIGTGGRPVTDNDKRQEVTMDKEKTIQTGPVTLTEQQAQVLDYLNENFVKLAAVINGFNANGAADIPRYAINDARKSKLFMFSEELAEALKDFSVRHSIDQRDLVESAVIDFMLRYGGNQTTNMPFRRLLCA